MPRSSLDSILDKVLDIRSSVIAVEALRVDREYLWPEAGVRALQGAGIGGLVVEEACGGHGHGLLALARVCEVIAEECPSTALCLGMHLVGSAVIGSKATTDQKESYLVPIAQGKHLTTLALSEPGSGAHFYFPETELVRDEGAGYRVTGKKSFVTNGGRADSYVVSTRASDPLAPPDQFSCVMVRQGAEGLQWGPSWRGVGMRGNSSRALALEGTPVALRELLGEEGDQLWYVFQVVAPYFLMAMAGTYLGIATAALREAVNHLGARQHTHSGASLAEVGVLQHRIGVLWAMVERTRRFVYHAATQGDAGAEDALPFILSSKAEVADCAVTMANESLTMLGGIGYREGSRSERLLRDARAAHVMAPTTDLLRTWTGRVILKQPLLGE